MPRPQGWLVRVAAAAPQMKDVGREGLAPYKPSRDQSRQAALWLQQAGRHSRFLLSAFRARKRRASRGARVIWPIAAHRAPAFCSAPGCETAPKLLNRNMMSVPEGRCSFGFCEWRRRCTKHQCECRSEAAPLRRSVNSCPGRRIVKEVTRNTLEMPWEDAPQFPGTAEAKVLRDDPERGASMIVRLPPGGAILPHSHPGIVQHFVLRGEYEHHGCKYGAGTYRLFPAHMQMARITTGHGAEILMIYDPAARSS